MDDPTNKLMCPVDFRPTVRRRNLKQGWDLCTGCADGHDIKEPCNVHSSNIQENVITWSSVPYCCCCSWPCLRSNAYPVHPSCTTRIIGVRTLMIWNWAMRLTVCKRRNTNQIHTHQKLPSWMQR
jgi:hypothetical protein